MYKAWRERGSPARDESDMTMSRSGMFANIAERTDESKQVEEEKMDEDEIAKIRLAPIPDSTNNTEKKDRYRDLPLRPILEEDIDLGGSDEGDSDRWQITMRKDDMIPATDILKKAILRGDFRTLPPPRSHVVRIFLSSTFSDMRAERNALHQMAHPKLQQFCQGLGLEYQVVDMRWGVPDEAVNEHLTSDLCLHEIRVCQRLSAGPNFVTMLGNRYGYRPLQVQIPAAEFDCLLSVVGEVDEPSIKAVWNEWYKYDGNADPPVYVLQPIGTVLKYFNDTKESHADLRLADKQKWESTSTFLYSSITNAASKAVEKGLMDSSRLESYTRSVTEEEVYYGVLENPGSSKQCVAFHRHLTGYQPYLNTDKQVQRYIDTIEKDGQNQIDDRLQARLQQLAAEKVPTVVGHTNCCNYSVEWNEGGVTPESQDHQKYLQQFCQDFIDKLCQLIENYSKGESSQLEKEDPVFSSLIKEVEQHARFCNEKCSTFCGRSKVLDEVKFYIESKHRLPLVIHGESGIGKTSVMAMVTQLLQKWFPDCKIVLRFLGTSKASSTITSLLQSICEQLCYLYNIDLPTQSWKTIQENFSTLSKFFHALLAFIRAQKLSKKPLFILLDSLDQLSPADGAHLLTWLPRRLPKGIHIIVSTIPRIHGILARLLSDPLMAKGDSFIELQGLDAAAGADVLKTRLEKSSRKLSRNQEDTLIAAFKQCPQALYIKLAIDVALSWHSYDDPQNNRLRHSVQEAIIQLFLDLENKFGSTVVRFALGYITVTRGGLSQVELEDVLSCNDQVLNDVYQYHNPPTEGIVRIPPLLWARISYELNEYLTEREVDGKTVVYWYHRQFAETAMVKFVERIHEKGKVHPLCCGDYTSHSHRLHSHLAKIFSAESGIQRTIRLDRRKLTIHDADRCVTKQTLSTQNLRWLNALPYHLMQPSFHSDDTCQQLRELTLCNFHWILAKLQRYSPSDTLREYNRVIESCSCQHDEVVIMRDFLVLAEPGVRYRATLLATEVLARLPNIPKLSEYPHIQTIIKDARIWLQQCKVPVIYPVNPCFVAPNGLMKSRIVGPERVIAVPSDARFVVGYSKFYKIRLGVWSTSTNELLHILELPPGFADPRKTKVDQKGSVVVTVEEKEKTLPMRGGHRPSGDIMLRVYNPIEGTLKLRLCVAKQDECTSLDLSPDGVLVVLGTALGMIYIIDLERQKTGVVEAHSGPVTHVRLFADGSSMVSAGRALTPPSHPTVTSWVLSSLKEGPRANFPFPVYCDAFCVARNKQTVLATCGENTLLSFQVSAATSRLIQCLPSSEHLTCVDVAWDGRTAVVGGSKGHVWMVHPETPTDQYEPVLSADCQGEKVASLQQIALTWDAQFAAGATNKGKIYIWHLPTLRKVKIIDAHATAINGLSLSIDHEVLFSSAPDLYIKLWRIGHLLRCYLYTLSIKNIEVREAAATTVYKQVHLTNNRKLAVFEAAQGPPELWDISQGRRLHLLKDPRMSSSSTTRQMKPTAKGDKLLVASDFSQSSDGTSISIHAWDMTSPMSYPLLTSRSTEATIAAFSPDLLQVVFVHINESGSTVKIWSTEPLTTIREFYVNCESWDKVTEMIITCDKKFAVILEQDDRVKQKGRRYNLEVINLEAQIQVPKPTQESTSEVPLSKRTEVTVTEGSVVTTVTVPQGSRSSWPSTGSRYLVKAQGGQVWEINARDQTIYHIFDTQATNPRDAGEVESVAVSEDQQWLAVGTESGVSVVFDLHSGDTILRTQSPHDQVWSIDISLDKSLLVCGYRNNMIEVWEIKNKHLLCDIMTHSDAAKLAISSDNKHLVSIVDFAVKPKPIFLALQVPT